MNFVNIIKKVFQCPWSNPLYYGEPLPIWNFENAHFIQGVWLNAAYLQCNHVVLLLKIGRLLKVFFSFVNVLFTQTPGIRRTQAANHTPAPPHTHTRTYIHPLLSDVHSWQSSWTSVFRGQNVPDWTSSAQSRVSNIQYITNLSRSLSLCAVSALALPPSVFPSHCLLLSVSLTTNAAKLRVSCALYISASISLTRFVHAPNLYSLIFLPCTIISFSLPCVSCPHVLFLTLPELASLSRSLALLHHSLSLSFCSVYSPAELQG